MKKIPKPALILIYFGVLLTTLQLLLKHFSNISDSLLGFLVGLGIGIELIGLIAVLKFKKGSKY